MRKAADDHLIETVTTVELNGPARLDSGMGALSTASPGSDLADTVMTLEAWGHGTKDSRGPPRAWKRTVKKGAKTTKQYNFELPRQEDSSW